MGKKSRRSKPKNKRNGGGAPQSAFAPSFSATDVEPSPPTPGAACWICLDGDPDEGGKPIVRDCSCRGEDAGFVHLSCLVGYAETKTKELIDTGGEVVLIEPWRKCPICRQHHQRQVALDMAKSYMSFFDVDENYPYPDAIVQKLDGFNLMINTIFHMNYTGSSALREEGKRTAYRMISEAEAIDEVTKKRYEGFIDTTRILALSALARFAEMDCTKDGYELALQYQEKIRDWHMSKGDESMVMEVKTYIEMIKAKLDGADYTAPCEELVKGMRNLYENTTMGKGGDSPGRIQLGLSLAKNLNSLGRGLECERLLNELEEISCRVFGPDHPLSKDVELGLRGLRRRRVGVMSGGSVVECNALGFNSEKETYNVEGQFPLHGIYELGIDMFKMAPGTPVICHGLKNAKHLNGKIGDVIGYDAKVCCYEVRFEDSSMEPTSVKEANLRILFDLPDKQ